MVLPAVLGAVGATKALWSLNSARQQVKDFQKHTGRKIRYDTRNPYYQALWGLAPSVALPLRGRNLGYRGNVRRNPRRSLSYESRMTYLNKWSNNYNKLHYRKYRK